MSSLHPRLAVPDGLLARVQRFVRRRLQLSFTRGLFLVLASTALLLTAGAALDHLLMLGPTLRLLWLLGCCLPALAGLLGLARLWARRHATTADMRRLDNSSDDMRAALNLADRLGRDEPGIDLSLAGETARRSQTVAAAPLPPMPAERGRVKRALLILLAALLLLLGFRLLAPDLHTVVRRATDRQADYGTVGQRKFQLRTWVEANPASAPALFDPVAPDADAAAAVETPADTADAAAVPAAAPAVETRFQDAFLQNGQISGAVEQVRDLADRLAGYHAFALTRRRQEILAGDKVTLNFSAVDGGRRPHIADLEVLRLEEGRQIPLQYAPLDDVASLTLPRLQESQLLVLRSGSARSPIYELVLRPRPTPTRIVLYQTPPAHYGQDTSETTVRDLAAGIDTSRLSGLPGARLAVEFDTPYGDDLDLRASYAMLGDRKLPLRRLTSRNAARRERGEQVWTFDFTLDESVQADPKLYLHLQTARATYAGAPITNRYDDPLLVHVEDDQPPTIEVTMLPSRTHFEKDAALAFRYRYTDDYGIAELGLELQPSPTTPSKSYIPLEIRPTEQPGQARLTDEVLHIIDLSSVPGNFLAFNLVAKDLMGQEAKTATVSITMSRHFTEELLPKLTGGWKWAWPHAPNNLNKRDGDLETPPQAEALAPYGQSLRQVLALLDGAKPANAKQIVNGLQFPFMTYLDQGGFETQPFAYHHRDYPYYFRRQSSLYLTSLARLGLRPGLDLAKLREMVPVVAAAADPQATPEYAALQALAPTLRAELAEADGLLALKREIAMRAALLRAAHLCRVIDAGLAETQAEFARLQAASAGAPQSLAQEDPWRVLVDWAKTEHPDFDRRQQATLVALQIRNLNRRQAALCEDLDRIEALGGDRLDPRLRAAAGMVRRFGDSIYGIDREAARQRMQLLGRFIREGILASEDAVYEEIGTVFAANADLATAAAAQVARAARYETDLTALLVAARALSYAQLHRRMGDGRFPADMSVRLRRNQESQLRSELELLNRQASGILFAEPFLSCADLVATMREAEDALTTIATIRTWLETFPELAAQRAPLETFATALQAYIDSARVLLELQRRVGTLADFAPMFPAGEGTDARAAALTALGDYLALAPTARLRVTERLKLQDRREREAAQAAVVAELDAALQQMDGARQDGFTALEGHLRVLAEAFRQPPPTPREAPADPARSTPPQPLVAGVTPALFERYSPDRMLAELQADLQAAQGDATQQQAHLQRAMRYYLHYPTDAGADILANPLAEYLQARISLALIACDPGHMGAFARTYTEDGQSRHQRVLNHLQGDKEALGAEITAWVQSQAYPPPTLPTVAQALAAPYLQAQRQGQMDAFLAAQRQQRLAELAALSGQLAPLLPVYESMRRARALQTGIVELLEDVQLYHLTPDDIRVAERWARLGEQAEGLDRDLRSGRLAPIQPEERAALLARVGVFRQPDFATVLADPAALATLRAYRDSAGALADRLQPQAAQAVARVLQDRAAFERDLALTMIASFDTMTWYRRKLQAEYELQHGALANLPLAERMKRRNAFGPSDDARTLQRTANLTSFAWRALLTLTAADFAADPTPAKRDALHRDLIDMLVYKALPEHYYDGFTGRIARLRYAAFTTADALVSQMLDNLDKGQTAYTLLLQRHADPAAVLPLSRDAELQAILNDLGVISIAFRVDKDLGAYSELATWILADADSRRRAAARIRKAHPAQGIFWRELGGRVQPYIEAGDALLTLNPRSADAATLAPILQRQHSALDSALLYLDRVGQGLTDTELAELAPVLEAQDYTLRFQAALADPAARADALAGYGDIHAATISYLKSIHSSMYPEPPAYQPRARYKHAMHNFGAFDFQSEILDTEFTWFTRADRAQADVYRALLLAADRGLSDQAPQLPDVAFAYSHYIDTTYRYLMAYASPEPGGAPPPAGLRLADGTLPQHLSRAFSNALSIDLPDQDNAQVRQLYFEALQETRDASEADAAASSGDAP